LLDAWLEWGSIEKILVCFRDPKEVAESLRKRNRLPLWIGFWLWKFHNTQLLETIEKHKPNQVVFITLGLLLFAVKIVTGLIGGIVYLSYTISKNKDNANNTKSNPV
jgi:hypothetical protein